MYELKATKKQQITLERLERAAACLGFYSFINKTYNCKDNAQMNLQGKTHYADSDTISFFGGKINGAYSCGGLRFVLLESIKCFEGGRTYKVVTFEIFGGVLEEKEFTSSKLARDYFDDASINEHLKASRIIKQTKEALKARFKQMDKQKKTAIAAMRGE